MSDSRPYPYPVKFTGNGVIAQGKFYPYKFVNSGRAYPHLDPVDPANFLAVRSYHVSVLNTVADTMTALIVEGYKEGKSMYLPSFVWTAATDARYDQTERIDCVFDQGQQMTWTPTGTAASSGVIWQYAEIALIDEQQPQQTDGCGLIDWFQGECIHGYT
jgi:hypothetical protein